MAKNPAPPQASGSSPDLPAPGTAAVPGPYSAHLALLLRLRWAEALLSAAEAEDIVAEYASRECQLIAAEERDNI